MWSLVAWLKSALLLHVVVAQVCFDNYGSGFSSSSFELLSEVLQPVDNEDKQRFGKAVDIHGNRSVVCSYLSNSAGIDAGKCFVFVYYEYNASWVEVQALTGQNPGSGDYFGFDVHMDGDWLIIGASQDTVESNAYAGSATVYHWNGAAYASPVLLQHPTPNSMDLCGTSVSIQSPKALVGCPGDDATSSDGGAILVFHLIAPGSVIYNSTLTVAGNANDNFGSDMAVDNGDLVVGAAAVDTIGSNAGLAYLFTLINDQYVLQYPFSATGILAGDRFGDATDTSDHYIVVGAPNNDAKSNNAGAAYLFYNTGSSAVQLTAIYADNPSSNAYFGETVGLYAVSPSRLHIIVGAYRGKDQTGTPSGAAYLYVYDIPQGQLNFLTRLLPYNGQSGDYFGGDVAACDRMVLIGAERDSQDNNNIESGTAYLYKTAECSNNSSECYDLQFDIDDQGVPLVAGQNISQHYENFQLTISSFAQFSHPVRVFDTEAVTCAGGSVLGTPNEAFNGTGVGTGGSISNDLGLGKVLVLQNNAAGCSPEVYNGTGYIMLNFSNVVSPKSIVLIDGRTSASTASNITLYADYAMAVELTTKAIPYLGPNNVQTISLTDCPAVAVIKVNFGAPGAIASFSYCVGNITYPPTPSPTPTPTPTPVPSPTPAPLAPQLQSCESTCANFTNFTSGQELICDALPCTCSAGETTCDVYSSGPDWVCVEPTECCTNPNNCTVSTDCCGGYVCFNSACGVTPTPGTPSIFTLAHCTT